MSAIPPVPGTLLELCGKFRTVIAEHFSLGWKAWDPSMLHIAVDQHARTTMRYGTPNEASAAPRLWDGADER